jgi:anti-sigma factor RsiW
LNCKGVIRELSNYIDGDLDPVLKHELERHLEHCEDCTMIVDQTKKSIKILCDSKPIKLSADVRSRLHAAVQQKTGQKPT